MFRNTKFFVVLGVTVLAFGLLFGTAMADPGDGSSAEGWNMHEQMDPELYGQMIQRMTEVHGAEFTAEMLQRMSEGGDCHGGGQGMMGAGMMNGVQGMMNGGMMNGGMMNDFYGNGGMMGQGFDGTVGGFMRGVQGMMEGFNSGGMMDGGYGNSGGMMNGGMMGR